MNDDTLYHIIRWSVGKSDDSDKACAKIGRTVTQHAHFYAVCSASTLAVEPRISSPFSSQSHEKSEATLRRTYRRIYQLQPTTKSDKLGDISSANGLPSVRTISRSYHYEALPSH